MKRFLATLLAVVMVLALAVPALADTMARRVDNIAYDLPAVTLTADKTEAYSGDTVNVTINLSGEFTATQLVLQVYYDSDSFQYVNHTNGEVASYVQSHSGLLSVGPGSDDDGSFVAYGGTIWQSGNSFSTTGTVVTLKFTVKQGAELGDYDFHIGKCEFAYLSAGETNATPIEHTESDCTVTVLERPTPIITATASKTELQPGDTFTVTVRIDGNFEAAALNFRLPYDNTLFTAGNATNGEVMTAAEEAGFDTVTIEKKNTRYDISINGSTTTPLSATGVICTMEFTVKDDVEGTYTFEVPTTANFTFEDMDEQSIACAASSETVTITKNVEPEDVVFHAIPSKTVLQPGETFTVDFTITGTYQSHSNDWQLNFDNTVFEAVSFVRGEVLTAAENAGGMIMEEFRDSDWRVGCMMPTNPLSATGTIATLTFKVKDDAANGTYAFTPEITTFKYVEQSDQYGDAIEYTVEGAEVTIGEAEPVEFSAVPSKTELQPGETFTVGFVISGAYAAHSMDWRLTFDNTIFEAVSFERGEVLIAAQNAGGTIMDEFRDSDWRVLCMMTTDPLTAEGTIATITFKVKDDAPAGTYTFTPEITTFQDVVVGNNNGVEIPYTTTPADVTVTAPATYAITWKVDGQDDVTTTVNAGEVPEYPYGTPIKQADAQYTYEFAGWDPEVVPATEDATYTATWTRIVNEYTVTWVIDGEEETVTYEYGETPTHEDPVKEGYTFTGWDPEIVDVTGNATYTAQFTVNKYRLTIYYLNEKTGFAMPGATAVFADIEYGAEYSYTSPEIEGYHLVNPAQTVISGTMPAQSVEIDVYYAINVYTITFVDEDGTELQSIEVEHGTTPVYDGVTPTKDNTQFVHYEFAGWTPNVVAATEDATYTAVFDEIPAPYTVKFYVKNDVLASVNAYYLTEADIPADVNWYGYHFDGWDMTLEEINAALENGDVTVNAKFSPLASTFTVTIIYADEVTTKDFTESRWITVKAKAEKNGKYFQYWTMNDVIISYSPRANVRVVADCELKAVYGDTQPADVTAVAQLMKATYADNRITFLFYFAAPDGATIDKAGIWACNGADYENYGQLLDADNHRFERFCSISNATEPASYTWIKTNVAEGDSWYVRPFVTYTLNGEQVTFKGEIVKITAGTDYDIGDAN